MPVDKNSIASVPATSIKGRFYRLIRQRFANEPLAMTGSLREGGRYNVTGLFGALYLSFDKETCQAEVTAGILAGLPPKAKAYVLWDYEVSLKKVARLDDDDTCNLIGVTQKEISVKGDHQWATLIGLPLFTQDFEGLVAPSAQKPDGKCLDVFLDNVRSPSTVKAKSRIEEWPPP